MKHILVGMLFGAVAGLSAGAIAVARNKKLSNKINSTIDSGEEKIKNFAEKLKGTQKQMDETEKGTACVCS